MVIVQFLILVFCSNQALACKSCPKGYPIKCHSHDECCPAAYPHCYVSQGICCPNNYPKGCSKNCWVKGSTCCKKTACPPELPHCCPDAIDGKGGCCPKDRPQCCPDNGCCPKDTECCPKGCCPKGSSCCEDGDCCSGTHKICCGKGLCGKTKQDCDNGTDLLSTNASGNNTAVNNTVVYGKKWKSGHSELSQAIEDVLYNGFKVFQNKPKPAQADSRNAKEEK